MTVVDTDYNVEGAALMALSLDALSDDELTEAQGGLLALWFATFNKDEVSWQTHVAWGKREREMHAELQRRKAKEKVE